MEPISVEDLLLAWLAACEERSACVKRWTGHGVKYDDATDTGAEYRAEWTEIIGRYFAIEDRLTAAALELRAARTKGAA